MKSFPCILQYLLEETKYRNDDNDNELNHEIEENGPKILLEIGCGSGSSCIPILRQYSEVMMMKQQRCSKIDNDAQQSKTRILLACDSSAVAVATTLRYINSMLRNEELDAAHQPSTKFLFDAFVSDPSLTADDDDDNDDYNGENENSSEGSPFTRDVKMACAKLISSQSGSHADFDKQTTSSTEISGESFMLGGDSIVGIVLLVFVLSAITPSRVYRFLENVFRITKPGGKVCFRDYGRE